MNNLMSAGLSPVNRFGSSLFNITRCNIFPCRLVTCLNFQTVEYYHLLSVWVGVPQNVINALIEEILHLHEISQMLKPFLSTEKTHLFLYLPHHIRQSG